MDRDDSYHAHAVGVVERLRAARRRLITTKYVVYETHAGVLAAAGREAARQFLSDLAHSSTRLARVTGDDEVLARNIVFRFQDKDYSLCDAASFAVMERLGITIAFTYDDHFRQYGFSTPLDYDGWP
jgi:predicted nucleic acid-binding protein